MSFEFATRGEHVTIDPTARIIGAERISVGSHVRIDAHTVISAGSGGIAIGDHVHIAAHAFIAGAGRIEIHDFAGISGGARLYSSNDDYSGEYLTGPTIPGDLTNVHSAAVTVGRHVVVGAGAVILPGVTLGEGSAVGALSLVRDDVAPLTVVGGVPARPIGSRSRRMFELEAELRERERR
jgi:dTDP-4-amino-4,6-dideoxy-D-glucose acyltransferase